MTSAERVAVVGTGLIGTSIAMAAVRAGEAVRGFDADPDALARAAERSGLTPTRSLEECVAGSTLVFVCTPIPALADLVAEILRLAPDATVTDVGSVKTRVMAGVEAGADPGHLDRYVGGHPMGGSERSGPEHASASVLDGVVWVLSPAPDVPQATVARLDAGHHPGLHAPHVRHGRVRGEPQDLGHQVGQRGDGGADEDERRPGHALLEGSRRGEPGTFGGPSQGVGIGVESPDRLPGPDGRHRDRGADQPRPDDRDALSRGHRAASPRRRGTRA